MRVGPGWVRSGRVGEQAGSGRRGGQHTHGTNTTDPSPTHRAVQELFRCGCLLWLMLRGVRLSMMPVLSMLLLVCTQRVKLWWQAMVCDRAY